MCPRVVVSVFHLNKKLSHIFPESCLLIIIGVIIGVILFFVQKHDNQLDAKMFFLILLPPIILDAGYFMPNRSFFDNLGTILLYAVIGTLLNTLWIGFSLWGVYEGGLFNFEHPLELLHALVFASLLAAVDPVAVLAVFEAVQINEILHIVVFGESLLNDGISVVSCGGSNASGWVLVSVIMVSGGSDWSAWVYPWWVVWVRVGLGGCNRDERWIVHGVSVWVLP